MLRQGEAITNREALAGLPVLRKSDLVAAQSSAPPFGGLAGPLGFSCDGPHDPFLQVIELVPDSMAGAGGLIQMHPAFAELGVD